MQCDCSACDCGMQHYVNSDDNISIVGAINRSSSVFFQTAGSHPSVVCEKYHNSLGHDL
jgi:hypothetical protein